jgi:hypothetical protein
MFLRIKADIDFCSITAKALILKNSCSVNLNRIDLILFSIIICIFKYCCYCIILFFPFLSDCSKLFYQIVATFFTHPLASCIFLKCTLFTILIYNSLHLYKKIDMKKIIEDIFEVFYPDGKESYKFKIFVLVFMLFTLVLLAVVL